MVCGELCSSLSQLDFLRNTPWPSKWKTNCVDTSLYKIGIFCPPKLDSIFRLLYKRVSDVYFQVIRYVGTDSGSVGCAYFENFDYRSPVILLFVSWLPSLALAVDPHTALIFLVTQFRFA